MRQPSFQKEKISLRYCTRKKPVRRALPEHLAREVIEHDIAEEEKFGACSDKAFCHYHVRPKYGCNRYDNTAQCLRYSFLKAWASESFVSHAIVS
ncbi:TPA: hypothetical protein ACXYLK_003214 [Legionella pneumophila]|uniref:hypothetical protein n=1 Tax=Legionella anisa TaxID=28082 RepID=UPI0013A55EDE|nr:hypothetical protein [Legionella anisa]MCW8426806.1 transposase [Legionella anisa]MCW8426912.1 transposase [Legionella anisa]